MLLFTPPIGLQAAAQPPSRGNPTTLHPTDSRFHSFYLFFYFIQLRVRAPSQGLLGLVIEAFGAGGWSSYHWSFPWDGASTPVCVEGGLQIIQRAPSSTEIRVIFQSASYPVLVRSDVSLL